MAPVVESLGKRKVVGARMVVQQKSQSGITTVDTDGYEPYRAGDLEMEIKHQMVDGKWYLTFFYQSWCYGLPRIPARCSDQP